MTLIAYAYKLIDVDLMMSIQIIIALLKNTYKWVSKIDDDGMILGLLDDSLFILKIIVNKHPTTRKQIKKELGAINSTENAKEYIGENKINDFISNFFKWIIV